MRKKDEERVARLEKRASCRHARLNVRAVWVPDGVTPTMLYIVEAHWKGTVICADCGASWPACGVEVDMKQKS